MADAYLQYEDPDTGIVARWHGGEYIDLGYVADSDSYIRNNQGIPSHYKGEFVAHDVINVWDHAKGEARIEFTPGALRAAVEEKLEDDEDEEC